MIDIADDFDISMFVEILMRVPISKHVAAIKKMNLLLN
ncbi:hypothetical protein CHCC5022_4195 [Bacillus paralicheniformis]|nr:hypothetical protein CHCC5022_4195 [Bacillus paralicheniformis]TWJ82186.1 hypothetical protein CHCC4186_1847 [Bacillus paralicheniformis]